MRTKLFKILAKWYCNGY